MFGLGLRLRRERDDAQRRLMEDLKARLRERLSLAPDDGLAVNEIACADPGCPAGVETVVLIMRRGERTRAIKMLKAMTEVTDADIEAALAEARRPEAVS